MSEENLLLKLNEYVNSILHEEGYISYDVKKLRITPNGGGYMGVLYEIDIKGKTADNDKETNIFAKLIVPNAEQMQIYSVADIYQREAFSYKELSVVLNKLQNEFNVPKEKRFEMVKCFSACNSEAILLENIRKKGYKTYNRMDVIELKYAELSIQHLAKFHALSMALEDKRPEYFKENIKVLRQPYIFEKDWFDFVNNMTVNSMKYLDKNLNNKYDEKIRKIVSKYPEYMTDSSSIRTLCHGDYRHNNIMALEINGQPSLVQPVDYQILHYGCPILDLIYFIFNGTDQEFRKAHIKHLKDMYYDTLKNFLEHFTLDVELLFSRETFERLYKEKLDFGLMINVFYIPFLFASEDDIPDVTESLGDLKFKVDPRFGNRFRGVIEDFIKWGYL